jgi:hypothetical protein
MHGDERSRLVILWLLGVYQIKRFTKGSNYLKLHVLAVFASNTVCLCSFPAEEVDIGELLHLINITTQGDLLVVEQNPSWILTDEGNVVTTEHVSMACVHVVSDELTQRESNCPCGTQLTGA